jgi:hypothetical protein
MVRRTSLHAARSYAYSKVRSSIAPLLLTLGLAVAAQMGLAKNAHPAESYDAAERLTQSFKALNIHHQGAAFAEKEQTPGDLLSVATSRQQLLLELIEHDPGAVLQAAVSADVRAGLPPEVQAYVEEEIDAEGELEILHEDRDPGSRYLYFLKYKEERFSLHFAADPPALQTGSHVRVKGVRVERALALESSRTSVQALATVQPNSFGEQRTIVILVTFQDKPTEQPYTPDYARGVFFGTSSEFFLEVSYQQAWLAGDVVGWYTIPLNSTVCDYSKLATEAKSAATAAGVNLSAYPHHVYAFPQNACGWWGLASVGGNPSETWINGTLVYYVVGHEIGHNLGLFHSRLLDCGSTTLGSNCTIDEYGDTVDIMGSSRGHYNAFQKERLGWLDYGASPPITTVQADGTYWLDPYESMGGNPKVLKILKATDPATGKKTWYYVEFRQAIGFDSVFSGNDNILNGVVIHTGSESDANSSDLLDMTPTTSSMSDPALAVGKSFTDPNAEVTIAATWASSTSAAVSVTLGTGGTQVCVPANPTVSVSPSQSQSVLAGTSVSYTVSVTNNDNADCTTSSFTLQATAPTGWSASFASSTLNVSPGSRVSTTLQVASSSSAAGGSYPIGVTTRNSASTTYSASTSVAYLVASTLNVTVSTNRSSYTRGQSFNITAVVKNNGSRVNRAMVTFRVTKPNGTVITNTITTGTSGTAVYKLRLASQDPLGTYQVRADASLNNARFGSATTSFSVQSQLNSDRGSLRRY